MGASKGVFWKKESGGLKEGACGGQYNDCHGKMIDTKGQFIRIEEGNFLCDNFIEGKRFFLNENTFEGRFHCKGFLRKGKITFKNGDTEEGQWDEKGAFGTHIKTITKPVLRVYELDFENGQQIGEKRLIEEPEEVKLLKETITGKDNEIENLRRQIQEFHGLVGGFIKKHPESKKVGDFKTNYKTFIADNSEIS